MKMSGNTVLITGGSMGIGFAMAEYFLNEGNDVIICGRRESRLLEAQKKLPKLHIKTCDVAVEADRAALAEWVTGKFGGLNILVNNAGIQRDISFKKGIGEYKSGPSEIAINLEAPIILSGMLIPFLTGRDGAAIINVSSGLGFVPAAKMPVYSATKAALHVFTMCLRHQLKDAGIKVFEVIPPAVDTELNPEGRASRGGYKANLEPGEFVAAVMKGLSGDVFEIGYGMTEQSIKASRADLDKSFQQMNSRW
jgi:uncharacterized oxidoreductase